MAFHASPFINTFSISYSIPNINVLIFPLILTHCMYLNYSCNDPFIVWPWPNAPCQPFLHHMGDFTLPFWAEFTVIRLVRIWCRFGYINHVIHAADHLMIIDTLPLGVPDGQVVRYVVDIYVRILRYAVIHFAGMYAVAVLTPRSRSYNWCWLLNVMLVIVIVDDVFADTFLIRWYSHWFTLYPQRGGGLPTLQPDYLLHAGVTHLVLM